MFGPSRGSCRLLASVIAAGVVLLSVGCATDSPAEQGNRARKAAAVPVFKLHMTKDLWDRTKSKNPSCWGTPLAVDKPKNLTEDPAGGLATIELTGPQMVDYLKILDFNAHEGCGAHDEPLAEAVYDVMAPVIDSIQTPPAPDAPAPEVTINAAVSSGAAPTTAPASTR